MKQTRSLSVFIGPSEFTLKQYANNNIRITTLEQTVEAATKGLDIYSTGEIFALDSAVVIIQHQNTVKYRYKY